MKIDILIIHHKLSYGGANKMVIFVANTLASIGYNVGIYTYASSESSFYELDKKIIHYKEKKVYKNYYTRRFLQIVKVRKIIKQTNPQIVLSFMTNNNLFSILGTVFTGKKVIISERGDPYSEDSFLNRLKKWFFRFADVIVFQTQGARHFYSTKIQEKSIIIPNPVIEKNIHPMPSQKNSDEIKISFVGRFEINQKRQDVAVKALEIVVKKYPTAKLYFYGDGEDQCKIKDLVANLNLIDNVKFCGRVSNIEAHIFDSDIFVLASDYEGMPNSLIEAMSIGLPCISSDCSPGGAREIIIDGINGFLFPIGDFCGLADRIIRLIENPDLRSSFKKESIQIKNKFSEEIISKKWCNIVGPFLSELSKGEKL